MSANVKFLKGIASAYTQLATKDGNTFYYTSDDNQLYLGNIKLSNAEDLAAAVLRIAANETDIGDKETLTTNKKDNLVQAINELKAELKALIGGDAGSLTDMITAITGTLGNLKTDDKTNLVSAINEINTKVGKNATAAKVTLEEGTSEEFAKVYTLKQGETNVGTINIPKDMVVSSGSVKTDPAGQKPGTYIELVLANATKDKIYIEVGTLVDLYKAKGSATQVQVAIDNSTREVSATLVAGGVTSTELATDAVITAKIADKNVTKAKLEQSVQTSLEKADSAVQKIAEGGVKGTIAVDGSDIKVKGLGTSAYTDTSAFDPNGSANSALQSAKTYTDNALTWGTIA